MSFPLILLLFVMPTIGSQPDLNGNEALAADEVRSLLTGRCEVGTVVSPSSGFDGEAGQSYRACYLANNELRYTRGGKTWVGWWHLSGPEDAVGLCRGPDPARSNCRVLKRQGDTYYGVGASSGRVRYEFKLVDSAV